MEKYNEDALSAYYSERKAQGKTHTFWMGKVDLASNTVAWTEQDHRNTDGIGAFITSLESMGINNVPYPSIRNANRPDADSMQKVIEKAVTRKGQWKVDWKVGDQAPSTDNAIEWKVLNKNLTQRISNDAEKNGVTLNTYLLCTLNEAVGGILSGSDAKYYWGMPVNMRGAVELPNASQNHFSFISIAASPTSTPQEIHREIKTQFNCQEHWAYWEIFRFMASGPEILTEAIGSASDSTRMGTFSNLGQWHIEELDNNDTFVFVPSITPDSPIAIGVTHINGKLGLAMHADPSLGLTAKQIKALMSKWIYTLDNTTKSSESLCETA